MICCSFSVFLELRIARCLKLWILKSDSLSTHPGPSDEGAQEEGAALRALFFSLGDEADIANTTHFCDVWKRQEFEVPPSAFGHSQHSASSSFFTLSRGLGICKFLFQDPPTFRAGEEFASLSGPECNCQEVLPRPCLQKQAAEHRMPTVGYEWSKTHGHYDLDVSVPHSLRWFPGQRGKPIGHRHPICVLSVLL